MLLTKIAVPVSNWYRRQAASPAIIPVPDLSKVFDDIEDEQPWQPILSPTFLAGLGLWQNSDPRLHQISFQFFGYHNFARTVVILRDCRKR